MSSVPPSGPHDSSRVPSAALDSIRVAPKPSFRAKKKARNVFYDDRGFPDQSSDYDNLLHNIDGGVVLRRRKFVAPTLDIDDPLFNFTFSEDRDGPQLAKDLDLSHLEPANAIE